MVASGSPGSTAIALPPVIGHRGAAGCAPENTLAGFRMAKSIGCRWVEFDVRLTGDGAPVLLHDNRLERTTDGRGRVSARARAAIRRHDAGRWFGPAFAGERVPSLAEALALLAELNLGANIELKAVRGKEAATATSVAGLVGGAWPAPSAHVLISSFQRGTLEVARDHAPHLARGILFRSIPRDWRRIAEELGCATIHADHQRLDPSAVAEIRRAGYPLLAYTVNDAERAKRLFDWGVTSVFSDVPHRLEGVATARDRVQAVAAERLPTMLRRQGAIR
jgi:glycerophosphoryl diester phosphodiesterase